ncbi:hypothetical protein U1Q18_030363 [Sarracenia purpurea var. burkii]
MSRSAMTKTGFWVRITRPAGKITAIGILIVGELSGVIQCDHQQQNLLLETHGLNELELKFGIPWAPRVLQ